MPGGETKCGSTWPMVGVTAKSDQSIRRKTQATKHTSLGTRRSITRNTSRRIRTGRRCTRSSLAEGHRARRQRRFGYQQRVGNRSLAQQARSSPVAPAVCCDEEGVVANKRKPAPARAELRILDRGWGAKLNAPPLPEATPRRSMTTCWRCLGWRW
jgi:hypothetical protein